MNNIFLLQLLYYIIFYILGYIINFGKKTSYLILYFRLHYEIL